MANYNTYTGLNTESDAIAAETVKGANTASRIGLMFKGVLNYFSMQFQTLTTVSTNATVATSANVTITYADSVFKFLKTDFTDALVAGNVIFAKNQNTITEIGIYQIATVDDTYYCCTRTYALSAINKVYVLQGDNMGTWHRDGNGSTISFLRVTDKENLSNKVSSITDANKTSQTLYPSNAAVTEQFNLKANTADVTAELATKADLVSGLVPSSQLPSYVDDVVELLNIAGTIPSSPAEADKYFDPTTSKIETYTSAAWVASDPEKGKIYISTDTNYQYRWSGTALIHINVTDLSGYYLKTETDTMLSAKADKTDVTTNTNNITALQAEHIIDLGTTITRTAGKCYFDISASDYDKAMTAGRVVSLMRDDFEVSNVGTQDTTVQTGYEPIYVRVKRYLADGITPDEANTITVALSITSSVQAQLKDIYGKAFYIVGSLIDSNYFFALGVQQETEVPQTIIPANALVIESLTGDYAATANTAANVSIQSAASGATFTLPLAATMSADKNIKLYLSKSSSYSVTIINVSSTYELKPGGYAELFYSSSATAWTVTVTNPTSTIADNIITGAYEKIIPICSYSTDSFQTGSHWVKVLTLTDTHTNSTYVKHALAFDIFSEGVTHGQGFGSFFYNVNSSTGYSKFSNLYCDFVATSNTRLTSSNFCVRYTGDNYGTNQTSELWVLLPDSGTSMYFAVRMHGGTGFPKTLSVAQSVWGNPVESEYSITKPTGTIFDCVDSYATANINSALAAITTLQNTKAGKGANADITSITGLTTALSLAQGGTGATTATNARTNLGAAASGANADISSITGLTGNISFTASDVSTVGSNTNPALSVYAHRVFGDTSSLQLGVNDVVKLQLNTANQLTPVADNSLVFGGASNAIKNIYTYGLTFGATITPVGTTGAQTINKSAGRVNVAAGATSIVVTNSLVTANSIITAVAATHAAGGVIESIVKAAGSFTIYLSTAPTAEMAIDFIIIN